MKLSTHQNELITRIKNELDIDLNNYRNDDLMEQISRLIAFQSYLFTSFILPFIILLMLFISTFWVYDFNWFTKVLVSVLGSFWLIFFTTTIGIYRYFKRVKKDLIMIVNFICDTMNNLNLSIANNVQFRENKSEKVLLLFNGLLFSVLIPSINESINKKIPFFKNYFEKIIQTIIQKIYNSLKKTISNTQIKTDIVLHSFDSKVSDTQNKFGEQLNRIKNNATSIVNSSMKIIIYPITAINIIQIILIICSLYLLSF